MATGSLAWALAVCCAAGCRPSHAFGVLRIHAYGLLSYIHVLVGLAIPAYGLLSYIHVLVGLAIHG